MKRDSYGGSIRCFIYTKTKWAAKQNEEMQNKQKEQTI